MVVLGAGAVSYERGTPVHQVHKEAGHVHVKDKKCQYEWDQILFSNRLDLYQKSLNSVQIKGKKKAICGGSGAHGGRARERERQEVPLQVGPNSLF